MLKSTTRNISGILIAFLILLTGTCTEISAQNIDNFEGFAPVDGGTVPLRPTPRIGYSVTDPDGDPGPSIPEGPYLEQSGNVDWDAGFFNDALGEYDRAAPGYEPVLGEFFLRLDTGYKQNSPVPNLILTYEFPANYASGQIWDIDGNMLGSEQWRVDALGSDSSILEYVMSPVGFDGPASLDGKPWTWSFDHGGLSDIYAVRISYTGSKTGEIGLGFDNFTYTSTVVPEPISFTLFTVGGAMLGLRRFRKKK